MTKPPKLLNAVEIKMHLSIKRLYSWTILIALIAIAVLKQNFADYQMREGLLMGIYIDRVPA